jgi:S1-C subfamily serine protease
MRKLIAVASCLILLASPGHAQETKPDAMPGVLASLVKIISVCGANEARIATGFVWGPDRAVVTDLHVVVGCQPPYTVLYFQSNNGRLMQVAREATVAHVLRAADLVMLKVTNPPPDAPPLQLADHSVAPEQWVEAWGFPLGVEAPINVRLQVTFANALFPDLSSTLDEQARAQLGALHFPDLTAKVLHLSGPLEPGDSGAPVLDSSGRLVGIGSGGLQAGASSISWAMRAEYLTALAQSSDTVPNVGSASALFAYATRPAAVLTGAAASPSAPLVPAPASVACGGVALTDSGARPLSQLYQTDKVRARIAGMARAFGVAELELASAPFQVWIEPRSGATIVVPAEAKLEPGDPYCRADIAGAGNSLLVRLGHLPESPATPEWRLAVSMDRWRSLVAFSRMEKTPLFWFGEAKNWNFAAVENGTLVQDRTMWDRKDLRVFRADVFGRGVSIDAAVVVPTESAAAHAELLRLLVGLALSGFPPRDATETSDLAAPAPDVSEDEPVQAGPGIVPYISCGTSFMMMSAVPSFGALAAAAPDLEDLASELTDVAHTGPDALRTAQYAVWAQDLTGTTILLPRLLDELPKPDGADSRRKNGSSEQACLFTADGVPWIHLLLYGQKGGDVAPLKDMVAKTLADRLNIRISDWHKLGRDKADEERILRLAATGSDSEGRAMQVVAVAQAQLGWSVIAAAITPAILNGQPRLRLGVVVGGLLLAPEPRETEP